MGRLRAFLPVPSTERDDRLAGVQRQLDQLVVLAAVNLLLTAAVLVITFGIFEARP